MNSWKSVASAQSVCYFIFTFFLPQIGMYYEYRFQLRMKLAENPMITRLRTRPETRISHRFLHNLIQLFHTFWCNSATNNATNHALSTNSRLFWDLLHVRTENRRIRKTAVTARFQRCSRFSKLRRSCTVSAPKTPWNTPGTTWNDLKHP